MTYLEHILTIGLIYGMLAASLDLAVGHTGMFSVAQAAFFGIGGYSAAILSMHGGLSFLVAGGVGILIATVLAAVVSIPTLRLTDEYFLVATFAYQVIVTSILNNWEKVTRGALGISGIPHPFARPAHAFTVIILVLAAATLLVLALVERSPFGRVLHALREDEILTRSLGKNIVSFKVAVFAFAAAVAALAGALFAWYTSAVSPLNFTITESILVVSMVIIGGAGSTWGPFGGAVLLVVLPEVLRFVGLPAAAASNLRQMLYGVLMIAMLILRPRGVLGRRGVAR